jgi:predicted dehydrogenase
MPDSSAAREGTQGDQVTVMTLDPGHFHAALLQKTMHDGMSPAVYVYAPAGADVEAHVQRLEQYNRRPHNPTYWQVQVYTGADYLDAMRRQAPGNMVVIAGINSRKTGYIKAAVEAGLHVLADKPLCIDQASWQLLYQAFETAAEKGVLLSDLMTSRYEITNLLGRQLVNDTAVFGTLQPGTPDEPAVRKESVHHLFKYVSGQALRRPAWYFDVTQQGEGIVDVTTHLVDLVMWECWPEQAIEYTRDIEVRHARHWPTPMTRRQFEQVTGLADFPPAVQAQVDDQGVLQYACNGEIDYTIRGVHVRVVVRWDFRAPPGGDDTHTSEIRGTLSRVHLRQDAAQQYRRELYVAPVTHPEAVEAALRHKIARLQGTYPGVGLRAVGGEWHITVPDRYRIGHEAHFGKVAEAFLRYLRQGALPAWEVPNMLAKYYTTTRALELARP